MTEFVIKNILSELLFESRICESFEDKQVVDFYYKELLLERLLYGQPLNIKELRTLLRQKILNFEFIKLDGEIRPARGTTMMKYVPQSQHPKGIRPSSPKVATFYDLDKKDWRSVSEKSKEIVLKQDEVTKKPIVMVKDKPEDGEGEVAVTDKKPITPTSTTTPIKIGDVFGFTKIVKIKYQSGGQKQHHITTFITITKKEEDEFWGKTAGSKLEIALTPERLERLGDKMEVGDQYQYVNIESDGSRDYTDIEITRKSSQGFWGKVESTGEEILLTNEKLKYVHKYEDADKVEKPEPPVVPGPEDLFKEPEEVEVKKVKPVESTDNTKPFHFINTRTGASMDVEMSAKDVIKQLKKLGPGWELRDVNEFEEKEAEIDSFVKTPSEVINKGETRQYLNRRGENVDIEILGEDPDGGIFAKTLRGTKFKIPKDRVKNIGQKIDIQKLKTIRPPGDIINKGKDLDNIEADEI